ncbi:smc-like protein [Ectocarpus siliculosus]|uniref:Smc-like protein n=1 Tax=Ectocarpus siliculosus TaxID=2880 RepID=D7G4M2_ECTSI|nr:smc-like protein [Ectocarpus siliculosus]|eukprot:CBJ48925.1 smc-like protein [Ectocarpus siliculosus]
MAPTRRRASESSDKKDEPEMERSPKAHRLSNGSRASTSSSPDGSTTASPNESMNGYPAGAAMDEDREVDNEEQASGSKGKGKRRFIPDDKEANEEEEEEEEEDLPEKEKAEDFAEKARQMAELCREQEEEDRRMDDGEKDAADEENDAPRTKTKKGKKEKKEKDEKSRGSKKKSEAGVVLKINVSNFMCHRKLTVPLCKQVNFINGRNGSGKSAILAALQICLGAKAHLTHRAKKMTDFIRHGWKGDAVLEVTLLNTEHGFMFEEYGESITIRRTIKQPSGGGFALVGADGAVKSKEKSELTRLLDTLNIQVDNPCAVLDQENSKKFLQGSESDKYAFFMKATDLERIHADSLETGRSISTMKAGHHDAVSMLPKYQEIVRQLKLELKEYENLRELKEKINRLQEQTVWAHVNVFEEAVAEHEEAIKERNAEVEKGQEKIAQLGKEIEDTLASKEEVKARYDTRVDEITRLKKVALEAGKQLVDAQAPLLQLRTQRSTLEGEKRDKTAAKSLAARKVKAAREAAKRSASDQREKTLLGQIQQTEDSLSVVASMLEQRGGEEKMFQLGQAVHRAQDAAGKARQDYDNSSHELVALKQELRSLETEKFDPLRAMAPFMPGLVRKISQEARQFSSPPVGPIGASIQLKEECQEFRACIEGHLSRNLNNFVVSCQQDKTRLMAVVRSYRGSYRGSDKNFPLPTIIVQAPQARYRPPQNPPGYLQIMQAINVNNDQAFNSLVDQCSIEKNCLFATKEEAEKACLRGRSGSYQRMPHGMFEAYYPSQGGKSCSKFNVSDGNVQTRMNIVDTRRHKSVLGVDEGTQKQEIRAQIQQTNAVVEQLRAIADAEARTAKAAETAMRTEEQERFRLDDQSKKFSIERTKLANQLMALQAKKNDSSDPTEELERDLEVATEELDGVLAELATMEGQIREIAAQVEPFKQAKEAAKKAHKEAGDAASTVQEEFEDSEQVVNNLRNKINRVQGWVAKISADVQTLSRDKDKNQADLEKTLEKANLYMTNMRAKDGLEWDGVRVESRGLTVEQLEHKVQVSRKRYEKEREKRCKRSKTKEEVESQLLQAYNLFKEKEKLADTLEGNMEMLSNERNQRTRRWRQMRDFVARQTSRLFDAYLQEKGASGEVRFDNECQTLGLTYQKDSSDNASQCSDVKLLSGGERSFATLALLLALGQSHECPFRVMDEFDVFMDAMSRNIAIKQVIEFAKRDSSRQFILITPQDLSSVTASDACKIIKMQPPRKGDHNQTTLEETLGGGGAP